MTALQNKRSDLRLVAIADGARDNGNFLATDFSEAIQIRDFFHAAENLKKALDNIYPTDSERAKQRWNELRGTLRRRPTVLIRFLQHCAMIGVVETDLTRKN
ncbi:MAG: hypothetical protein OXE94_12785 [Aestuariivita sp.]|nr:hypothetical protein [Aestuariivita sp.]MCY4202505.1 hypothetical protein [Aestuariivita sp.]